MVDFAINQRLSYSSELCTVRFVGELSHWPGEMALGVEWDQRDGKNDGVYNSVRYFTSELRSASD
jgi:dynactin complex subunit